nr:uncharacterized protein LOC111508740 [Leptinotarsa decemlineata]
MAFFIIVCLCMMFINATLGTPYGFVAVRGKKADPFYDISRLDMRDLPLELFDEHQSMRPYENKLLAEYLARLESFQERQWDGASTDGQYKRTPYRLMGVRGKRSASSSDEMNTN